MSFRISKSIFGEGLEKALAVPDGRKMCAKKSIGKKRTQTHKTLRTVRLSAETRENSKSFSKDEPKLVTGWA